MKDIITDICNKVISFFQSEKENSSKEIASNRLKLVLMQDRTNLDTATMERMRNELIEVISRYIVLDQEALELNLANEDDSMALMLTIPVLRAKTPEEIAEAIAELGANQCDDNDDDDDIETEIFEIVEDVEPTEATIDENEKEEVDAALIDDDEKEKN